MWWMLYIATMLASGLAQQNSVIQTLTLSDWKALNASVGGRLHDDGAPFARACFQLYNGTSSPIDPIACAKIQAGYTDHFTRLSSIGSYTNPQWETCQSTSEDCLLDWTNPTNSLAFSPPRQCFQGSVSRYFIDVRKPSDVIEAFKFSKRTGVPLVVKNTGHDYSGRSSAPNSLALWTRNIQHISYNPKFVAEGCRAPSAQPGVTFGAGNYFDQLYQFAEQNNLTIVGGSDRTVGAAGGWVQGGGHSVLSNTLGLGVDRVLEFKVITPTGDYLTVNACQNQELFFALRGGGGGTFGVVFETTFRAEPKAIPLQVMKITFPENLNYSAEFLKIGIDNADRWASEGWGGYINAYTSLLVTPKLTTDQAKASVKPVLDFVARVNGTSQVVESPSFYSFYNSFILVNENPIGLPGAPTSRLVPRANFATNESRATLHNAIMTGRASSQFFQVIITTPISYKYEPGKTAVTDAWRNSLWHVVYGNFWNYDTSRDAKKLQYDNASKAVQPLRDITPGSGAYQNEADIYEPNHEFSFWGSNYNRLLATKKKYDPTGLLGCWHCVGSRSSDSRLSCYL